MEPKQELLGYINLRKEQGATTIEIANELKGEGWTEADIEGVMKKAFPQSQNDSGEFAHIVEQPKEREPILSEKAEKTISTVLGSLIILLAATIAGSTIWWTAYSYEEPVVPDVMPVAKNLNESIPKTVMDFERRKDGLYLENLLITWGDPDSLEYIHDDGEVLYTRDKDHVYYYVHSRDKLHTLEDFDSETFQFLGSGSTCGAYENSQYLKDKNNVVYKYGEYSQVEMEDADSQSFEFVGGPYAKDDTGVYMASIKLEGADPETFDYVGGCYGKDSKKVFYLGNETKPAADPTTIEYVGPGTAKDKSRVYFYNQIQTIIPAHDGYKSQRLEGPYGHPSPSSFEYVGGDFTKDKEYVFFGPFLLEDLDTNHLEYLDNNTVKDQDSVYWGINELEGADVQTFRHIEGEWYRDDNHLYPLRGWAIEDVDFATLEIISDTHAWDYKNIYTTGRDRVMPRMYPWCIEENQPECEGYARYENTEYGYALEYPKGALVVAANNVPPEIHLNEYYESIEWFGFREDSVFIDVYDSKTKERISYTIVPLSLDYDGYESLEKYRALLKQEFDEYEHVVSFEIEDLVVNGRDALYLTSKEVNEHDGELWIYDLTVLEISDQAYAIEMFYPDEFENKQKYISAYKNILETLEVLN
jgi:hypothetical protein